MLEHSFVAKKNIVFLAATLVIGICIRAYLAPTAGFKGDMSIHRQGMKNATEIGIVGSYADPSVIIPRSHGPIELSFFAISGHLYKSFVSSKNVKNIYNSLEIRNIYNAFAKLPATACDIVLFFYIFVALKKIYSERDALIGSTVFFLHPATWYNSAFWGQTDVISTMFIFGAFLQIMNGKRIFASALFTMALVSKPTALLFLPLFSLFAFYPFSVRNFFKMFLGGFATLAVILLPFIHAGIAFGPQSPLISYLRTGKHFERLTWNADNIWRAAFGQRAVGLLSETAIAAVGLLKAAAIATFGGIYVSLLLLLFVSLKKKIVSSPALLFTCAAMVMLSCFVIMPSMHDRYFYPYIVFGVFLIFESKIGLLLYAFMSSLLFLNLVRVLPAFPWMAELSLHPRVLAKFITFTFFAHLLWFYWHVSKSVFPRKIKIAAREAI